MDTEIEITETFSATLTARYNDDAYSIFVKQTTGPGMQLYNVEVFKHVGNTYQPVALPHRPDGRLHLTFRDAMNAVLDSLEYVDLDNVQIIQSDSPYRAKPGGQE